MLDKLIEAAKLADQHTHDLPCKISIIITPIGIKIELEYNANPRDEIKVLESKITFNDFEHCHTNPLLFMIRAIIARWQDSK